MKVVVDTFPPSVILEPDDRRGSLASVHWEVKDENLDLKSLVLEYQVEGVGVWRRVPIRQPKSIGAQSWDAGTAEALKVRASVADKAGNVTEASIDLPEGTASQSDLASNDATETSPLSIDKISSAAQPEITAGSGFTPVNEAPVATRRPSTIRPSRLSASPNQDCRVGLDGPGSEGGERQLPRPARGLDDGPFATANGNDSGDGIMPSVRRGSSPPAPTPSRLRHSREFRSTVRPRWRHDAAGAQPKVQAPVCRRRSGAERPGHLGALDHAGWRTDLDSPRRRPGPRLAD